jgi:2-oxo-4-hydroxy-4-carboxy--5-ureidoimidazoline (OHCU) decarboxylase
VTITAAVVALADLPPELQRMVRVALTRIQHKLLRRHPQEAGSAAMAVVAAMMALRQLPAMAAVAADQVMEIR